MSLKIKDKLSALLNNVCDDGPGVVLMARFDDGKEYYLGRGKADVERGIPVSKKTVFNIASLSKQFTAFCIHLLENAGEISLDDGVKNYIPELPDYANSIKIDNLIHHTSGLKDYIDIAEERGVSLSGKLTPAESLKDVCDCNKPDFIAGHEFAYSNTNYFLLSIIIERITGKKISQYAREMIFSPLNMNDTFYNESYPIVTETAKGYSLSELTGGYEHHESLWTQTGDGAVYSTPEDLMKWGGNFSNPVSGNSKIIDMISEPFDALIDDIHSRVKDYHAYGSGLFVQHDFIEKSLLHSGSWIGYASFFVRHVNSRLTVIVLSNRDDFNAGKVAYQASELLLDINLNDYDSQSDFGY
ncbi:Hypothetical protein ABZS17D1_04299 (plasmid) [Kosakonia cowanii]|uniref:serine hydrolase domain-containing protein n=1 Tax=Kosakonia cowanii TaxID=208223 RepID=UPI00345B9E31